MKLYQEMKIVKNSKDSEHGSWYRKALVLSGAEGGFMEMELLLLLLYPS
jgi:16S rRNA U1498 N3-methylase RsmE